MSRTLGTLIGCGFILQIACVVAAEHSPLALHPDNGHYFVFRGKPTVLITSGEHYGAVLNLDFDYRKYLKTLATDGLNNTRTFSGAYVEPQGAFNIAPTRWRRSKAASFVRGRAAISLATRAAEPNSTSTAGTTIISSACAIFSRKQQRAASSSR